MIIYTGLSWIIREHQALHHDSLKNGLIFTNRWFWSPIRPYVDQLEVLLLKVLPALYTVCSHSFLHGKTLNWQSDALGCIAVHDSAPPSPTLQEMHRQDNHNRQLSPCLYCMLFADFCHDLFLWWLVGNRLTKLSNSIMVWHCTFYIVTGGCCCFS